MVALAAGEDAEAIWLIFFEMELAGEFERGFRGFGAAGSEIDAAAFEIGRSETEETGGEFLGGGIVKLRSVGEGELGGLLGHGAGDFGNAVSDVHDGSTAGGVEEFAVDRFERSDDYANPGRIH